MLLTICNISALAFIEQSRSLCLNYSIVKRIMRLHLRRDLYEVLVIRRRVIQSSAHDNRRSFTKFHPTYPSGANIAKKTWKRQKNHAFIGPSMDLSFTEVAPTREDSAPGRYRGRARFVDFRLLSRRCMHVFAEDPPVIELGSGEIHVYILEVSTCCSDFIDPIR